MREPRLSVTIRFCPVCGRDDRFTAFTGKSHYGRDGRCPGVPVEVKYVLANRWRPSCHKNEAPGCPAPSQREGGPEGNEGWTGAS